MNSDYIKDLGTKKKFKIDFIKTYFLLSAILYFWTLAYSGYVTFFAALSIMILIGLHLGYHIFFVSKNALEINKDFIRIKKSQFDFEETF